MLELDGRQGYVTGEAAESAASVIDSGVGSAKLSEVTAALAEEYPSQ